MVVRAALARERAGERAVGRHGEVGGRFFRALGRGVGELPFAGQIALGRILWLFRLVDRESSAIDEDVFDFCFFVEQVAVGDDQVGDLSRFRSSRGGRRRQKFRRATTSARAGPRRVQARRRSISSRLSECLSVRRCRRNKTRTSRSALARAAGDDGARSRKRSVRSEGTSSGSASLSASGHFKSTSTGSFFAAISSGDFVAHLAAVDRGGDVPAIDQFKRAANLDGVVRGNQDQRVIFERVGERGVGAVVARARQPRGFLS